MGLYPVGGVGLITREVFAFGITWAYNRGGGLYPGFYGISQSRCYFGSVEVHGISHVHVRVKRTCKTNGISET